MGEDVRLPLPMAQLLTWLKFLLSVTTLSSYLLYMLLSYSFFDALLVTLLAWSLYVLCLPGAHGAMLIGIPLSFVYRENYIVEPYVWTFLALLNVLVILFCPTYYFMSFPTKILYSIIMHPKPCWLIFCTSFVGTFFYYFISSRAITATHLLLRQLILLLGYFVFLYFSHKHVVTLLGISVNP